MAVYETTGGDIVITTPNCDCGCTGGCGKCQPKIIPKRINSEDFIPLFNETWKYWKLREIRANSHKNLGKAWSMLAKL